MKTGKYGVYAVIAAVMLALALLLTSCSSPTAPQDSARKPSVPVPDGMGLVRLSVAEEVDLARTIIPTVPNFPYFEINIREYAPTLPDSLGTIIHTFSHLTFNNNVPSSQDISLPRGNYVIEILAFSDGTPADAPEPGIACPPVSERPGRGTSLAARGISTRVNVVAGPPVNVPITLHAIFTGSGTGTFAWNLSLPSGPFTEPGASATLTVIPRGGQTLPAGFQSVAEGGFLDLTISANSARTFANFQVGFYDVIVLLQRRGFRDRQVREVLHVAQNMTSSWGTITPPAPIVIPDLINEMHAVTFVNFDGTGNSELVLYYIHGQALIDHQYFLENFYLQPGYYRTPALHWTGWFTEPTGGIEWIPRPSDPLGNRILHPRRLYARWEPPIGTSINVTPVNVSSRMPALTTTAIAQESLIDGTYTVIRFNFGGTGFDFEDIVWRDERGNVILSFVESVMFPGTFYNDIYLDLSDPDIFHRYTLAGGSASPFIFNVSAYTQADEPHLPRIPWIGQVHLIVYNDANPNDP